MIRRRSVLAAALLAPLAATGCAAAAGAAPVDDDWAGFDAHLRDLAAAGRFSGAVLVTHGGRVLLEAGYGPADRATGEPVVPATRFCIASMGKMLTAVAIGQLVERGKMAFTDTLDTHLPGFPPEVADAVTLHHLLTHTSGMGDIFRDAPVTEAGHTIAALVEAVRAAPLRFAPGSAYAYSNAGFVVLGAIIEQVTGRPYAEHLREQVLVPAGMAATEVRSYRPVDVPGMAHPYALIGPDGRPVGPGPAAPPAGAQLRDVGEEVKGGSPAGGAISTAGDMAAFAGALTGHRLLGPELTDELLAGKVEIAGAGRARQDPPGATPAPRRERPTDGPPRYGYGFLDRRRNGVRIVGHNGGTPGYEGRLDIHPDTGHTVVVLTNQDGVLPPVAERASDLVTT